MNFFSNFDLGRAFALLIKKIRRIFVAPLLMLYRKILRFISPTNIVGRVSSDIKGEVKEITQKPKSLKEYFRFGDHYIAKKLVFVLTLLLMLFMVFMARIGIPFIQARFFVKSMVINTEEMLGYTGRVELLSGYENPVVLFEGRLEGGQIQGRGEPVRLPGAPGLPGGFPDGECTQAAGNCMGRREVSFTGGDFLMNQYEGNGILYQEGRNQILYEGGFAKGLYHGVGRLYYDSGTLQYEGSFAKGAYEGTGKLYDPEGVLVYDGAFQQGAPHGQGKAYKGGRLTGDGEFKAGSLDTGNEVRFDQAGRVLYEGQIAGGLYSGQGVLYENGILLYKGGFASGRYEGTGALYGEDGSPVYEGDFTQGLYNGSGRLYEEGELVYEGEFASGGKTGTGRIYEEGRLVYEGGLSQGVREGRGREYGEDGKLIYNGGFSEGMRSGMGKVYDSGERLLYEGNLKRTCTRERASCICRKRESWCTRGISPRACTRAAANSF